MSELFEVESVADGKFGGDDIAPECDFGVFGARCVQASLNAHKEMIYIVDTPYPDEVGETHFAVVECIDPTGAKADVR